MMNKNLDRVTFLFARPTFLRGMGRVLDLGNTLTVYNESPNEIDADNKAMSADWKQVGEDIRHSIEKYEYAE